MFNLARSFLLLSFVDRIKILRNLGLINDDEVTRLYTANNSQEMVFYKTAFVRVREQNLIKNLEQAIKGCNPP